jgi:hypothetical protein
MNIPGEKARYFLKIPKNVVGFDMIQFIETNDCLCSDRFFLSDSSRHVTIRVTDRIIELFSRPNDRVYVNGSIRLKEI